MQLPTFWTYSIPLLLSTGVRAEPSVYVEKTGVTYRGTVSDSVEHYHNIKFAHETSGQRRFAPPKPFVPVSGTVVDASSPGPACPQLKDAMPPFFSETHEISEDCLNLRIDRPAGLSLTTQSKLPVVVWLHGGGVSKGSAYDPHFDPDEVLKLSVADGKPIIYASLNYRLSVFGFARLPILKAQKSLNIGLRDQRAGFQWIKNHIEAFGGDPDRITAYGLSSGGTFISMHPLAYGGVKGVPFQQAWMMSGPPGTALNITSDATTIHTVALADKVGCGNSKDAKILECLRKLPMQHLIDNAMEYSISNHPPAGLFTFIPSVDDDFIPDRHSVLFHAGRFVKGIRMIFGWTQDDGAINAGPGPSIQTEDDMVGPLKSFAHALSDDQIKGLFAQYDPVDFENDLRNYEARKGPDDPTVTVHWFRLSRIFRDLIFTCSSIEYGASMVKHTQASSDPTFSDVRLYDLNQSTLTPLWKAAGMPYIGVSHGSDTNYIFNGVFPEGKLSDEDRKLAESFTRALVSFAYTGDPVDRAHSSGATIETWPAAYPEGSSGGADTIPSSLNIEVIGGPYGTGPATLMKGSPRSEAAGDAVMEGSGSGSIGKMQHVVADVFGSFKAMGSAVRPERQGQRQRQIERERLFERCAYISSLAETLGV